MKTEFFLGNKASRTTNMVYKKIHFPENPVNKHKWFKCQIKKGVLTGWVRCNMLPANIKPITEQEAQEFLFEFCL